MDSETLRFNRQKAARAWLELLEQRPGAGIELVRAIPDGERATCLWHPPSERLMFAVDNCHGVVTFFAPLEYRSTGKRPGGLRYPAPRADLEGVVEAYRAQGSITLEEAVDLETGSPRIAWLREVARTGELRGEKEVA